MYLDIIASNKHYNSYLANLYGLETAVYISEILAIYEAQCKQGKELEKITLNRKAIQQNTSLSSSK